MKTCFLYTKLFVALFFLVRAHGAAAAEADADRIMKAIDSICGDTWCEGAFDFRFHQVVLKPQKNEVQVFFRMSQQYPVRLEWTKGQIFQAQINQRFHDVSCLLPGYSTYDGIMQSEYVLRWEVYTALTQCINALEDRLMQINQAL
ncbi:hypothetical protein [Oligoflexus tunisiensis]|uniref:hypothetical protein n=1 Tax=Oligoflexus tunisiensis TaxID=708132 RepID=UPI00114CD155|nr:hypothetical protein [Oligoflexus tunisiensis]